MKKLAFVALLSLYTFSNVFSEDTYFQLRNSDLEEWSSETEPSYWHTYTSAGGSLSSFVKNSNQSSKITSDLRPGTTGSAAIKVNAKSVLGIAANGMMTTGQIEGGSTSATSTDNHNITRVGTDYAAPFTGRPDSVTAWIKTIPKDQSQLARFHFLFHNSSNTQDPGTDFSQVVAIAGANVAYQADWQRVAIPVYYNKFSESLVLLGYNGSDVTETKTPLCTEERPSYCLATIATNFRAGKGNASDALYIDDIAMIYNSKLATLTIDGSTISGFSKDKYSYSVSKSYGDVTVGYTTDGKFATVEESFDSSTYLLTLTVKGDDYSSTGNSHTYTIQFDPDCAPTLSDFTVNGSTISGFSVSTYSYSLSEVYADVTVKATANSCATATTSWDESTQTYTVEVSSGSKTNTYTFKFHAAYGSQITALKIDGSAVSGFSPSTYSYSVENAYSKDHLSYTADEGATVEESYDEKTYELTLTVKGGDYATNSGNTHTYTIQYHAPYESLLTDFRFFGTTLSGFSSATTSYNVKYAFSAADTSYTVSEGASAVASYSSSTYLLTLTVNGHDVAVNSTNKHVYTIQCHAPYASQLSALNVDGSSVKNFSVSKYTYTTDASYVEETTKVTWTTSDDATATGSYDESTNAYSVLVKGGDYEWNDKNTHTYTISFHDAYGSKLTDIAINGVTIEGFDPNMFEYTLSSTYSSAIEATPDDDADVSKSYDPSTYTMTYVVTGADFDSNPTNTHTYVVHFHAPYGSYLKTLSINGSALSDFVKTKTSYEVSETYSDGCISYEADEDATVTTSYDSSKGIFTLVVKGGDIATNASNTHTYKVTFHASYGSQLTSLKVNGVSVTGFSADVYNYSMMSAYDASKTVITYNVDEDATATGSFDATTNIYSIVVKGGDIASNPSNTHTYTIAFHDSYGSQLTALTVGGVSVDAFSPSTYQYTVTNAYDPSLLAYTADDEATVEKTEDAKNYLVTLKVKGGDYLDNSSNTHTYTIQFHAPYASQLTSLSNNGSPISGFSANIYKYSVNSTYENAEIEFTVSEDATYETTYDKSENQLTITVKGGDYATNNTNFHTYVVAFHDAYGSQLTTLKVDRVELADFDADKYEYLVESVYDENVTCEADADATYAMSFDEETNLLTIVVSGGDISSNPANTHTYQVQFEAPSLLTSLKVDGTSVSNFRDSKYAYTLTSVVYGNVSVTYTASEGATVESSYDDETGLLTLIVKGKDIKTFLNNTHTYTIQFHTSYSSYLTNLMLNGVTLEGFERKTLDYVVRAPYRDYKVTNITDADAKAKMSFDEDANLLTIVVTGGDYSENPSNTHTYKVQFYAPSQLTNVKVNNTNLSGFSSDVYAYDLQPNAYEDVKFVTYADEEAVVESDYNSSTYLLTVTVHGKDYVTYPDNKHVYTFQFSEPYSSLLSSLLVNDIDILTEGKTFVYDAFYKDVAVNALAVDSRATVTQSYDDETFQLTIRVEGGNISRVAGNYTDYVIQFNDPTDYGSQLQSLSVNGTLLSDFAVDNYDYYLDGSYSNMNIAYVPDEKATVTENFDYDNNALVLTVKGGNYAKDNSNVHTYTVKFTQQFSYGSQITNIAIDGVEDTSFTKESYVYTLNATYKVSEINFTVNSLAQYCEYYDDSAKILTVVVWGGDFAENASNFHTYVFSFSK